MSATDETRSDLPVVPSAPPTRDALAERIDHGVWGGASERERRRILRRRRQEAATADR